MKPKLFVTQPLEASALAKLKRSFDVTVHPDASKTITKEALTEGVRGKAYLFCRLGDPVGGDVISANPNLKLIATMASAAGGIDLETATRLKIPVIGRFVAKADEKAKGVIAETADLTWGLLMSVARRIVEGDRLVRSGVFPGPHSMRLLGAQVYGKTLGIVGMGRIGRELSKRAKGFDMKIVYYSRSRHPDIDLEFGAELLTLDELLKRADFVCLTPRYSKETYHLIGEKELEAMKPTAFLINTSRGPVVEQDALVKALAAKKIAGAALDVFEGEPHPVLPKAFLDMPNVVLTPHIGSAVAEKREIMANEIVNEIIAFAEGKQPALLFNPEALE